MPAETSPCDEGAPPQPSPHHRWSGWHWVFAQDVPRGSTPAAWLVAWLPVGLRHVWTARELAPGIFLVTSAASTHFVTGLEVAGAEYGKPAGYVATMVVSGMTAARVGHWIDTRRPWVRVFLTCVAVAKMQTGARWWWVVTPAQFMREAERRGFEVLRPCRNAK